MIRSFFHNLRPTISVGSLPVRKCLCERVWLDVRPPVETRPMKCGECGRTFDAPATAAQRGTE